MKVHRTQVDSCVYPTTYYLSATGNDTNTGKSIDKPWKTIARFNKEVIPNNSCVLFKREESFIGSIATSKFPKNIVFGAYGTGNKPIIYGSKLITDWKERTKTTLPFGIYEATLPTLATGEEYHYLYIDDKLLTMARYPNVTDPSQKNWLHTGKSPGLNKTSSPDLLKHEKHFIDGYWNGANLRIRNYSKTFMTLPVVNYTAADQGIEAYYKNASGAIVAGVNSSAGVAQLPEWGFYLDGKLEELDAPGEWWYSKTDKKIYLYPPAGVDLTKAKVSLGIYKKGILITTGEHDTVIENLAFKHFSVAGVEVTTSDNVKVQYCYFEHNSKGINFLTSKNSKFSNNYFYRQFDESITTGGTLTADVTTFVEQNVIKENSIYPGYGKLYNASYTGAALGVYGQNMTIKNNYIDTAGLSGMLVKAPGNHLVEGNIVKNALTQLNDGGAITIASSATIRKNIFLQSVGNIDDSNGCATNATPCSKDPSSGMGVGADMKFQNVYVEENTILNNPNIGIRFNSFFNSTIKNNILVDAKPFMSIQSIKGPSYGNIVSGNEIYSTSASPVAIDYVKKLKNTNATFQATTSNLSSMYFHK